MNSSRFVKGHVSYNKGKKLGPRSIETKRKIRLKLKGRKRGPRSEEVRRKIRLANQKNWSDPNFIAKHLCQGGNKRHRNGIFVSIKNRCDIHFRSSDEVYAYLRLEHDDTVKQFGSCSFSVPYIYKGKGHRYVPDILVEYVDGMKAIIEVKPLGRVGDIENILKATAGREYCRENSMEYIIWTEGDIRSC